MKRFTYILVISFLISLPAMAQQSVGMQGLIHVPSADMDSAGVARIGAQYVPKEILGERFNIDGEKYNSFTNYLSITPFSWIEIGYGYTLMKFHRNLDVNNEIGFYAKDRYFSLLLRPLKEGKYWPSVAVGGNDVWGSGESGESSSNHYRNFYVAASKHLDVMNQTIGMHLAYRQLKREYNHKWDGLVGGITVQPSFYNSLRLIGEWDGNEVNIGADCRIFKFLQIQCALIDCQHFTGGICFCINLL